MNKEDFIVYRAQIESLLRSILEIETVYVTINPEYALASTTSHVPVLSYAIIVNMVKTAQREYSWHQLSVLPELSPELMITNKDYAVFAYGSKYRPTIQKNVDFDGVSMTYNIRTTVLYENVFSLEDFIGELKKTQWNNFNEKFINQLEKAIDGRDQ